ncbi:hypothetical protein K435DRAFT_841865 [Dendrothele bispora CBS 962.96]|uniref:Uncharacterized protein n=1 Tax=Dendrothele bispora (strain CBS 962.96) TaxID=1314807 RepID=A0A4V4HE32_DENBC|nr:hypothetical protein K435DRAFT_841865 [Dendrothele bispora CBS 962.96]
MGRWDQYEQDDYRLPDGFQRVGYDDETQEYVFKDREGNVYRSSPGVEYGPMTLVSKARKRRESSSSSETSGKDATAPRRPSPTPDSPWPKRTEPIPRTFEELPKYEFEPDRTASERFVEAVKKSAVPKLQGVVKNVAATVKSHSRNSSRNEPNEKSGSYAHIG